MAEPEEKEDKQTEALEIDDLVDVESGSGVDLDQFEGTKSKIEKVEIIDVKSRYDEDGNQMPEGTTRKVKVIKVLTAPVTKMTNKEGEEVDVSGSELFNLKRDPETKKWGISTSDKAKIRQFMKRMKVEKVKELIGKPVTIKTDTNNDGRTFLGFIIS